MIFATLVGQGLTLPFLIRWFGVDKQAEIESAQEDAKEKCKYSRDAESSERSAGDELRN